MSEIEYIEDYFSGSLSAEEKVTFEARCEHDPAFAEEVSSYVLSRQGSRDLLMDEKRNAFIEEYYRLAAVDTGHARRTWFPYLAAAAACVLLLIAYLTYSPDFEAQQLADAYIEDHLTTLSTTMGDAADSLSIGIAAFNDEEYGTAERVFVSLLGNEEIAAEATKYLGITYLKRGAYDDAIEQFDKLILFTNLYANPGKFYLAVTLMKRSEGDDVERARDLLQEVISEKLPGYKEASIWVEDF